ncbi:Rhodanese-like domain-containing protein, partial [Schizothecium vesticola]
VVSADWVSEHLAHPSLVVIDLRSPEAYLAGHIPSSLSLPWNGTPLWTSMGANNETLIMPSPAVVVDTLTTNGILETRSVVFVTDVATLPSMIAMATRSAATLRYTGIPTKNIGILDGGFPAWKARGYTVSTVPGVPRPAGKFDAHHLDASFIADREYVKARLNKADKGIVLIDGRGAADYKAGHIESALLLSAATVFKDGGMWKPTDELMALFKAAVGTSPVTKDVGEVIVYCWIGMLASVWFHVLTSMLGFENVKLYDGSMEDWT